MTESIVRWPDEQSGPWRLCLKWELVEGRLECVGLDVRLAKGAAPQPLTSTLLRSIPLARLVEEQDRETDEFRAAIARLHEPSHEPPAGSSVEVNAEARPKAFRGGPRTRHGVDHYAAVADVYRAAFEVGKYPTKAVAARFQVAPSTAATWVAKARSPEYGLLPPTEKGVARAHPTKDQT